MSSPALGSSLARVEQVFNDNFTSRDELGASVSVWRGGEEVLALAGGFCDRDETRAKGTGLGGCHLWARAVRG